MGFRSAPFKSHPILTFNSRTNLLIRLSTYLTCRLGQKYSLPGSGEKGRPAYYMNAVNPTQGQTSVGRWVSMLLCYYFNITFIVSSHHFDRHFHHHHHSTFLLILIDHSHPHNPINYDSRIGYVFNAGDTAWMLTATALVLLMTMPGLAIYYSGMVREKNVLACTMQGNNHNNHHV